MFNLLPILALGAVALGYAGAVAHADRQFDRQAVPSVTAFATTANLSVQDYVGQLPQAVADPLCDAKADVTAALTHDFEERFNATVDQTADDVRELWTSDLMGTWTVIATDTGGMACIVASGFGWTRGMTPQDVLAATPLSS